MKRFTILLLAVSFSLGVLVVPTANAGWRGKDKPQHTEKPEWMKRPQRYEGAPMTFHSGLLQQDGITGWKLGENDIRFTPDCVITSEGAEKGYLATGREAIIMGSKIGTTIFAWSVRVMAPDFSSGNNSDRDIQLKPSTTNPACGEITKAPM